MSRMKTFLKYIIWLVAFYVFSQVLIFIGLNASYKPIESLDENSIVEEVTVSKAEATSVNGRIFGEFKQDENNSLNGKYIKIIIYDKEKRLSGVKYIQIQETNQSFKVYFQSNYIDYYEIDIVDSIDSLEEEQYGYVYKEDDIKIATFFALLCLLSTL